MDANAAADQDTSERRAGDCAARPGGLTPPGSLRPAVLGSSGADDRCRRVLIQAGHNSFPDMTSYIREHFGFEVLQLADYNSHRAQGKLSHLRGQARQSWELLKSLHRLRNCHSIIAIGPVLHVYVLKLLKRLHLVNYRQSISLGLFFHSPRLFPLFRLLTLLDQPDDHYILFSDWEIALYRRHLAIAPDRMHCLPYGDWGPPPAVTDATMADGPAEGGYYFAGGYSNRDYASLIPVFRTLGLPLVIVCSALNREIDSAVLPANITVLRDVTSEEFEAYVRHAKACIIPLKHDTGASGQSVTVRAMRNGKVVIATDFGSVRGYILDGVSGYLVRDLTRDLPAVLAKLERDPSAAAQLGQAAYQRYCDHFSPPAGRAALTRILTSLLAAPP